MRTKEGFELKVKDRERRGDERRQRMSEYIIEDEREENLGDENTKRRK